MHYSSSLLFATLASLATAIPVDFVPNHDPCGPLDPQPGTPVPDSCTAKPTVNDPKDNGRAHAFGVQGQIFQFTDDFDWSTCDPVIKQICDQMALPTTTANRWYFAANKDPKGKDDRMCQMGFYLPHESSTGTGNANFASEPSPTQCANIFRTMLDANVANFGSCYGSSINLQVNPAVDGVVLPNGQGTGKAVDLSYPSYFVAHENRENHQGKDMSCVWMGTATPCDCNKNPDDWTCERPKPDTSDT